MPRKKQVPKLSLDEIRTILHERDQDFLNDVRIVTRDLIVAKKYGDGDSTEKISAEMDIPETVVGEIIQAEFKRLWLERHGEAGDAPDEDGNVPLLSVAAETLTPDEVQRAVDETTSAGARARRSMPKDPDVS